MIDSELFLRGHIDVDIYGRDIDDFDIVIPEHYFETILGLTGEVYDSNGSDYKLLDLTSDDVFTIVFTVDEVIFEADNGVKYSFQELVVKCEGEVVPVEGKDVLCIHTYQVLSRT